jgi:hypothetical protein
MLRVREMEKEEDAVLIIMETSNKLANSTVNSMQQG